MVADAAGGDDEDRRAGVYGEVCVEESAGRWREGAGALCRCGVEFVADLFCGGWFDGFDCWVRRICVLGK